MTPNPTSPERFVILAVDDRESNLFALRALFGGLPEFELITANSGEEALMATLQREVHLILLDVNMPGMDGFETAEHLQAVEATREIPIVFLTAVAKADAFVQRGYALGAVDYLSKPVEDNLLVSRVRLYKRLYENRRALLDSFEQLRDAQHRLLQTEKLAALHPMVVAVAHELNTPIGNCQLMASTLFEETTALLKRWGNGQSLRRSELESYLKSNVDGALVLARSLDSAAHIVARFKEMAVREHAWSRARFALHQVVDTAVRGVQAGASLTGLQIERAVPAELELDSYGDALAQVLEELLGNALLHGFEGRDGGHIRITAEVFGPLVQLCFSDDGSGMSPETVAKAFDPFYTTRFGQGRSGLGLSICYNLVVGLLGGEISVRSAPGAGSHFSINLPLSAPPRAAGPMV